MRGAAEGGRFVGGAEETLLVVEIGPAAFAAMGAEFAGGVEAAGFSFAHDLIIECGRGRVLAGAFGGVMSFVGGLERVSMRG